MQLGTPATSNRRREPRRSPKGWTKVKCYTGRFPMGKNLAVSVLDVAETGMRLIVRDALADQEAVIILLESPNHRRPLELPGRVVWCVEAADHAFCVGVSFDKRLSYSDLGKLC